MFLFRAFSPMSSLYLCPRLLGLVGLGSGLGLQVGLGLGRRNRVRVRIRVRLYLCLYMLPGKHTTRKSPASLLALDPRVASLGGGGGGGGGVCVGVCVSMCV